MFPEVTPIRLRDGVILLDICCYVMSVIILALLRRVFVLPLEAIPVAEYFRVTCVASDSFVAKHQHNVISNVLDLDYS